MSQQLTFDQGVYRTDNSLGRSLLGRVFPTCCFYRRFAWNVYRSSVKARAGQYEDIHWSQTSLDVLRALEAVGVQAEITGAEHLHALKTPCVLIANHMSMLETMVLPAIIQPILPVTFVVKQSLLGYPIFGHIMSSRNPVAVSRENPREDFKTVMQSGTDRLNQGISIVVFPQTTRSATFDPSGFNTIGVKLALRAGVPVIPIALKTDAWDNGRLLKDFGRIDPKKKVRFALGPPIEVKDRGAEQHQQIIDFIDDKLNQWNAE